MAKPRHFHAIRSRAARALGCVALAGAVALAACARAGGAGRSPPLPGRDCSLGSAAVAESPTAPGTIRIALPDTVDANHAPIPANDSERQLFAHLYEGLVRIDCDGLPRPALARSWKAEDDGRRWSFTLREDARWWDGSTVATMEVAAALAEAIGERSSTAARWPIASIQVTGERTLLVEMLEPVGGPLLFADPALAIRRTAGRDAQRPSQSAGSRRNGGAVWPTGTGPYRPDAAAVASAGGAGWTALALSPATGGSPDLPSLDFRILAGRDARNALDAGVDMLVTSDPAAIAYAARLTAYRTEPLPWTRTYALLAPASGPGAVMRVPQPAAEALARDAVTGEARASAPPYWWEESNCASGGEARAGGSGSLRRRIVYRAGDRTARLLGERLVALARDRRPEGEWLRDALGSAAGGSTLSATGLGRDELAAALRRGDEAAYIVAIDRAPEADCRTVRLLAGPIGDGPARVIVPLVDTRATAIVRNGVGGLTVDAHGTVIFGGVAAGRPNGRTP